MLWLKWLLNTCAVWVFWFLWASEIDRIGFTSPTPTALSTVFCFRFSKRCKDTCIESTGLLRLAGEGDTVLKSPLKTLYSERLGRESIHSFIHLLIHFLIYVSGLSLHSGGFHFMLAGSRPIWRTILEWAGRILHLFWNYPKQERMSTEPLLLF